MIEQFGDAIKREYMGGKANETESRFRCRMCGAMWSHIVESGAGGHGDFWHPATVQQI